jgi:hypothetical protein
MASTTVLNRPERRGGARPKSEPAKCAECSRPGAKYIVATGDTTAKGPLCANCAKKYGAKT